MTRRNFFLKLMCLPVAAKVAVVANKGQQSKSDFETFASAMCFRVHKGEIERAFGIYRRLRNAGYSRSKIEVFYNQLCSWLMVSDHHEKFLIMDLEYHLEKNWGVTTL